ncbi:hypothetical protein [uncultured Roseibium sp.]|uniref:hypothetical protein n=1 Tax=uncultured Roseibium sp. TaxID=1936171 RepID=UPI00262E0411|nr:hypothetical protein [uncultured Roseibium sp.]
MTRLTNALLDWFDIVFLAAVLIAASFWWDSFPAASLYHYSNDNSSLLSLLYPLSHGNQGHFKGNFDWIVSFTILLGIYRWFFGFRKDGLYLFGAIFTSWAIVALAYILFPISGVSGGQGLSVFTYAMMIFVPSTIAMAHYRFWVQTARPSGDRYFVAVSICIATLIGFFVYEADWGFWGEAPDDWSLSVSLAHSMPKP